MSLKTIITRKSDNVVTNIVTDAIKVENGLQVTEASGTYIILCMNDCNRYDNIETSDTIVPTKYCYDEKNGFTTNVNYKDPVTLESLQSQLATTQDAIDYVLMNLPTA
jgi:hypothetical protein